MSEFAKVTVIIETEEQTVTIRAPKAENVQIDEKAVEVIKHESNLGFTTYLNNTMQINVNFLANLDETEGRMYVVETLGKPLRTTEELHRMRIHPDYEYRTTTGPRKNWNESDMRPEGEGWERNVEEGRDGWERFDYFEESYWRRLKKKK